jgi:hypothetical protein
MAKIMGVREMANRVEALERRLRMADESDMISIPRSVASEYIFYRTNEGVEEILKAVRMAWPTGEDAQEKERNSE